MSAYDYFAGDPAMADLAGRRAQAEKILAVVEDFLHQAEALDPPGPPWASAWRACLDIGCSTGIVTQRLAGRFPLTVGVDVDQQALTHPVAHTNWAHPVVRACLALASGVKLPFRSDAFDVIVCNQVYQYVPDVAGLLAEIHRVVRPGGICFFSARNLLGIMARENWRPLLAAAAPKIAHRLGGRDGAGTSWRHRAGHLWPYFKLRYLAGHWFAVHDYTTRVLATPRLASLFFPAINRSRAVRAAAPVLRTLKPIFPSHLWILQKQPVRVQ